MDENVDPIYLTQLRRKRPDLTVRAVGEPGVPPRGTLDPDILVWCEEHNFILVTNNRKSMPVHLQDHINQGRKIPGILILNPNQPVGQTLDELILAAEVAYEDEYQDRIIHLPLT